MQMSRSHYELELGNIQREILALASRVEEDLSKAVQALRERDAELAAQVKADDDVVNAMQLRVQDMASVLIATQAPVARDMRELVSVIRMADNLERIGDYAVHLAKTVIKLKDSAWPRQFEILGEMGSQGCRMIRAMIDAFIRRDVQAARDCAAMDAKVDEMHHALVSMTLESLKSSPAAAEEALKIIKTSGFLERLGDHVTNGCELVVYAVTGAHAELNE